MLEPEPGQDKAVGVNEVAAVEVLAVVVASSACVGTGDEMSAT